MLGPAASLEKVRVTGKFQTPHELILTYIWVYWRQSGFTKRKKLGKQLVIKLGFLCILTLLRAKLYLAPTVACGPDLARHLFL